MGHNTANMMLRTLLAVGIAVATADMTCPSTPASLACGMKVTTTASASCADVLGEMNARIAGQYGAWHDPHNNGTYSVESYGGTFSTSRLTGDGKYTDKQIFTLTDQSGSCLIEACSRSQVNSLFDKGTNYCDVKMLFCGSNDGCKPVKNDFLVGQETTSKLAQASVDMGACLKVSTAAVVPEIASPKAVPVGGDPDDCHDPLNPGACGCPCLVAHDCEVCGTFRFSAVCRDGTCQATGLDADAQTSLYKISGGDCGQATLNSKYASYAEKFAGLTEGTCAAQGYTVGDGAQTLKVPVLGDITIAKFKKATAVGCVTDGHLCWENNECCCGSCHGNDPNNYKCGPPPKRATELTQLEDACTLYQLTNDACSESGIDCKFVKYAKLADKGLKDGTCAAQGFTMKGTETTKKYPFVGDVTITQYTKPAELKVATAHV